MFKLSWKKDGIPSGKTTDARPTIPLVEAMARTEAWRAFVSSLPGEGTNTNLVSPEYLFRAIHIDMADIDWLRKEHPEAQCIRVYMSIPDPAFPSKICGLLVPVDNQNRDMLTTPADGIFSFVSKSSIYDVTQPCPTVCDVQSPMFDALNSIEPYLRSKE
jgi:hypothetical protein